MDGFPLASWATLILLRKPASPPAEHRHPRIPSIYSDNRSWSFPVTLERSSPLRIQIEKSIGAYSGCLKPCVGKNHEQVWGFKKAWGPSSAYYHHPGWCHVCALGPRGLWTGPGCLGGSACPALGPEWPGWKESLKKAALLSRLSWTWTHSWPSFPASHLQPPLPSIGYHENWTDFLEPNHCPAPLQSLGLLEGISIGFIIHSYQGRNKFLKNAEFSQYSCPDFQTSPYWLLFSILFKTCVVQASSHQPHTVI